MATETHSVALALRFVGHPSGPPFFDIITIPISIYRGGDGDDRFCGGNHVLQIWEGRLLDSPERRLGEPEAPVEERHTGSFVRLSRFLGTCVRGLCVHTQYPDSGDDLQDPRHTRVSLPVAVRTWAKSLFVCGCVEQREGSPLLLLLRGWVALACSSHPPISNNLQAEVTAQKAYKAQEVDQGVAWAS